MASYNPINLAKHVASLRERYGLPPDPASDQIWVDRIMAGTHTPAQSEARLAEAAVQQGVHPRLSRSPGPVQGGVGIGSPNAPRGSSSQPAMGVGEGIRIDAEPVVDQRSIDLVINSLGLPPALVAIFREEYIRSGDINLALAAVRQSPQYDVYYPGNRREDGSIRYTEGEYRSVVDAYADSLADFGVNADIYADHFGRLISGEVSAQEFRGRVTALYDVIGLRLNDETSGGAWRQEFAEEFGVDPSKVTLSTVLGVALDPQIGQEVLERRLSIVQVTANATRFGFSRSRARAEALLNSGLQGQQAQQFYGTAAAQVPRLSGMAGRFNEREFGIEEFEDAFALGDVEDQRLADRLQRRERSLFSQAGTARQDQSGDLTGLRSL